VFCNSWLVNRFDLGDAFLTALKVSELDSIGGLTFDEFWSPRFALLFADDLCDRECLVLCSFKAFAMCKVRLNLVLLSDGH